MAKLEAHKISEIGAISSALKAENLLPGGAEVAEFRAQAQARFLSLGIPTTRQEEWRFTNVGPLANVAYAPATPSDGNAADALQQAEAEGLTQLAEVLLVIVNGFYRPELSRTQSLPAGVTVSSFSEGGLDHPAAKKYLGKIAADAEHPFMALNSALFGDGLFFHVPENVVITAPVHILYLATESDTPLLTNPRLLIVSEQSSQLTVLETFYGPNGAEYLTNSVAEFDVEDNAVLDHYRLNLESLDGYHVATLDARQGKDSNFSSEVVTFGSKLTRNDFGMHLDGRGAYGLLNGLYQISGKQHVDNHTRIDHAEPNCESHELYKGVLNDHASGVFNGRIYVRQIAQKTDSKQTNRSLLLSPDARVNTNPQLEIFADDVKCTHGATIGQIDHNQMYYLRSRGISEDQAQRMLVFAFANEMVERIKMESLRTYLEAKLLASRSIPNALAGV